MKHFNEKCTVSIANNSENINFSKETYKTRIIKNLLKNVSPSRRGGFHLLIKSPLLTINLDLYLFVDLPCLGSDETRWFSWRSCLQHHRYTASSIL